MIKLRTALVIDNKTIAASGSYTSAPVTASRAQSGVFSIHYRLQGSGTAKFEYLMASGLKGLTNRLNSALDPPVIFLEPSSAVDIASGITVASEPALHRLMSRAFTSGSVDPIVGETFTGAAGGATAIYEGRSTLSGGTFGATNAAGTFYWTDESSTAFQSENLNGSASGANFATIGGVSSNFEARDMVGFSPELAGLMQIRVTETGLSSGLVVSAMLTYQ